MQAYDKTGREIKVGDVLKVFHFVGARNKRHYMYKQVTGKVFLGRLDPSPFLVVNHLNMDPEDNYHVHMDGTVMSDYEIVNSRLCDHDTRPRVRK